MNPILKKLQYKGQAPVLILNAPGEYSEVIKDFDTQVDTEIKGEYGFVQFFAKSIDDANDLIPQVTKALAAGGLLWLCYPKGTSKKYKSDLNRDRARDLMAPYDWEAVSLVALDDDWSAVRFKKVDDIKTMKRQTAATEKGKKRIAGEK